jgi:hypothetical protein
VLQRGMQLLPMGCHSWTQASTLLNYAEYQIHILWDLFLITVAIPYIVDFCVPRLRAALADLLPASVALPVAGPSSS